MLEYVPLICGFLTGAVVQHTRGPARVILITLGVLFSGVAGTMLSGEYLGGWGRLPLDVAEATLGLSVALLVATGLDVRARSRRVP